MKQATMRPCSSTLCVVITTSNFAYTRKIQEKRTVLLVITPSALGAAILNSERGAADVNFRS